MAMTLRTIDISPSTWETLIAELERASLSVAVVRETAPNTLGPLVEKMICVSRGDASCEVLASKHDDTGRCCLTFMTHRPNCSIELIHEIEFLVKVPPL